MNRQNTAHLASILITILFITGLTQEALACGCGGSHNHPSVNGVNIPPPHPMPPPMPMYETMWKAEAVINIFEENGLHVEKQISVFNGIENSSEENNKEEAVSFELPSLGKDVGGSINTFKYKVDLEELQIHFLDLNKKGVFHTWSFAKDNVLVILTGNVPENIARQYETVLVSLKK